jgi:hypothetical protein
VRWELLSESGKARLLEGKGGVLLFGLRGCVELAEHDLVAVGTAGCGAEAGAQAQLTPQRIVVGCGSESGKARLLEGKGGVLLFGLRGCVELAPCWPEWVTDPTARNCTSRGRSTTWLRSGRPVAVPRRERRRS